MWTSKARVSAHECLLMIIPSCNDRHAVELSEKPPLQMWETQ